MNHFRNQEYTLGAQFTNLYDSAHYLIDRFDVNLDRTTAWTKFMEEVEELANEVAGGDSDSVAAEAVDVIVTIINVLRPCGVTEDQLIYWMRETYVKNDTKNWDTHTVIDGLIIRKDKLEK